MKIKPLILHYAQLRPLTTTASLPKKQQPSTKTKGSSSHDWLSRQLSDPFVEQAKKLNYRCRSAFKLLEIDDRFKILQPGRAVVDCGASPGSWTQVAVRRVNADAADKRAPVGTVIAVDRQLVYPIQGATVFGNTDFTEQVCQRKLLDFLEGKKLDAVLSDMAPNATGIRDLDTENIVQLCYAALKFAVTMSNAGASVLVKLWQCGQTQTLEKDIAKFYDSVKVVKPSSSRSDSAEIFILGRGFKGLKTT